MVSAQALAPKKSEKPDLDAYYKPVGINAINAASCDCCCSKEKKQTSAKDRSFEYPLPTD
ncbi:MULTISPECIES: hypothetical protein [Pseudovibrio]|uniref:hypothetical protein n=1 Tax=Stappiaceae TaxID=2821832 RepID=UPI00236642BA|nr:MULTISPECIES: hypothetical protein [Pseudovibrio]MDD7911181.1 hypothetical protein [Pseudovibrio exalbescens]MDX5593132.1 hypothetical protein [Pseudovibrio sp. SPO723]